MKIMTSFTKKMMVGVLAGAVLTVGGIGLLLTQVNTTATAAAAESRGPRGVQPPQMNAKDLAKHIAEQFGVDETQVQSALEEQKDFRDIGQAAMLAKLSGKSFDDVLSMKTDSNTWRTVGNQLGISREQVREARDDMMAQHLCQREDIDKDTVLSLLKDGYQPQDIEMAARLAKAADKDIKDVLSYKKINNRWEDVAQQLGIEKTALRPHRRDRGMHPMNGNEQFMGPMSDDTGYFCE